jgi:MFS family permease
MTGDPLLMSLVLATASIPRALFMLIGGALTDRFSARKVMLGSFILRLVIVGILASLVLTGIIKLWMLYGFAFLFGLVDAFYYPALNSSVPQMVKQEQLQVGNALIQGAGQLGLFAGPVLAGALIAYLDGTHSLGANRTPDLFGIGLVFVLNAATFLISALTIWWTTNRSPQAKSQPKKMDSGVWLSIRNGLIYVRNDATLLTFFMVTAAITFLTNGPFTIGVPVLADTRFTEGAAAFGIIVSAFGGGSLAGTLIAGVLRRPAPRQFGTVLLGVSSCLGIGLALLGMASSTSLAAVIALLMGTANGYVVILFITWVQKRTPPELLGRMMSLFMFAMAGLNPISAALAGALIKLDTTLLFAGAGSILVIILLISLFNPAIRDTEPRQADIFVVKDSKKLNMVKDNTIPTRIQALRSRYKRSKISASRECFCQSHGNS